MTIAEMHDIIDLLLDKEDTPWFNPTEKDKFINLALMEFAETRYSQFEFNEKRREELLPLVRTLSVTNQATIDLDAVPDFMFVLSVSGYWDDGCAPNGSRLESLKPVSLDKYAESQSDPFNRNDDSNPGYLQRNDGTNNLIEVLSSTSPATLELNYLKLPQQVDIVTSTDSDLPVATHEEIVNITVRKMMMTISDDKYQVQINEMNNQENLLN
jgi:hypothetical protein